MKTSTTTSNGPVPENPNKPNFGQSHRPSTFDFRLLIANRIVDQSWQAHQTLWTSEDIGMLTIEVLEEEFQFDWTDPNAIEDFKTFLAAAYVAAGDVLPPYQRQF